LKRLNIAVVGSGISGLSAAWLLSQKHDVTLIEADDRLGGHSHTVDVTVGGEQVAVDTGFIVSNTWTYPNFNALMDYLGQEMTETQMSFSVSMDRGRYEYSGDHLGTLLGRPQQWVDPQHWRLMSDLWRFYRSAEGRIDTLPDKMTLGAFLALEGYGDGFINRHILPIAGAIWSSSNQEIAQFPIKAFLKFFANHKLFILGNRPNWRTVTGGSRNYVRKLVDDAKFSALTSSPVSHILRDALGPTIHLRDGRSERFDQVVIATHGDQALRLLAQPTALERDILRHFNTSRNEVVLHRDRAMMPKTRRFWSGWNYRGQSTAQSSQVAVTYYMNALQKLHSSADHFVTLNADGPIDPSLIDGRYIYRHPIFTPESLAAQTELWSLQGQKRIWFAGAWFGAGFHEDGLQAGLAVAEQLGDMTRPWKVEQPSGRIHVGLPPLPDDAPFVHAAE
jgi:uncharacterized protein